MLDRQHLKIIEAVDKHGTVTEAANQLHLTQSALSHAIKKVELHFNVPIWRKNGRTLVLTQAGRTILNVAKRLLPQFEHVESQLVQYGNGLRGTLRIGMECNPCFAWLLKIVAPFLKLYPDIDVDVKRAFDFGGLQALSGYEIDVLLTPDPIELSSIEYQPLFDYEHVLVVPSNHVLATTNYVVPDQLAQEVLITYPIETNRLDIFTQFLQPAGCNVKAIRTIETTEIILQMVSAGRGVSALPRWLVEESHDNLNLVSLSLGKSGVHKTLFAGQRSMDKTDELATLFIQQILHTS